MDTRAGTDEMNSDRYGHYPGSIRPVRTSAKAVIIHEAEILLVKRQERGEVSYILPGGGQKPGESLPDALRRECREEAGVEVGVGDLLYVREYIGRNHSPETDADFHQVEIVFSCRFLGWSGESARRIPDANQIASEWVPLDKIDSLTMCPPILKEELLNSSTAPRYLGDVPGI